MSKIKVENTVNRPLLSFVMTGRNDGFMGDFNWRLGTSINVMARAAARLGRLHDLEVIVCDWNSEIPLCKVVQLVPEARAITKFVTVPSSIALESQKDTDFPHSIVINTGVRRASGEFISQTGSDVVFTASSLNALFFFLENKYADLPLKKAFMTGGRRHIPNGIVNRRLPLQELEDYLNRNAVFFPEERGGPGHGAPTNMMLMHRDLWYSSRGFDERMIYWGFNDIDLTLRITAQHDFIQLENYGVNSLHMEHYSKPRDYQPGKTYSKVNPVDNLIPNFTANDKDWGLGPYEIPMFYGEVNEPDMINAVSTDGLPWYGLLDNLGTEISKTEIQNSVREVLNQFSHLPIPTSEHAALMALVWCAAVQRPRSFVEIGFRYPHAAALVARHAPGTELFALVDFARRKDDDQIFYSREDTSLIFFLNHALRQNGQWAFTHYMRTDQIVDGKINVNTPKFPSPLDLVLIRLKDNASVIAASEVAPIMRKTGVMIITSINSTYYHQAVRSVLEKRPESTVVAFADGLNGLIIV